MKTLKVTALVLMTLVAKMSFAQIENFQPVVDGIDRSARPTLEEIVWVAENNYKSILNLEAGHFSSKPGYVKEEESIATENGLQFFHIPMQPMAGPTKEQIDEAHAIMLDPANQPILVHCKHGKDRTGMVFAAFRMKYQGWTYDQAVSEMKGYGFSPFFKSWLPLLKEYENSGSQATAFAH
jgi:tyrosine-protein phosphatase SIW14